MVSPDAGERQESERLVFRFLPLRNSLGRRFDVEISGPVEGVESIACRPVYYDGGER
jgi:hypothetical protein